MFSLRILTQFQLHLQHRCVLPRWHLMYCTLYILFVVYRVPAIGTRSPRIAYRQSLYLADMWHAYRLWAPSAVGLTNQNGVDVQALSNLAIGFPLF